MRLPLAVPTEPRNSSSLTKDALLQNAFIDKDAITSYIVKRAGMLLESSPSNATTVKGIFYNPNQSKLFYITNLRAVTEIVL